MRRLLCPGLPTGVLALLVIAGVIFAMPAAMPGAHAGSASCTAAPPPWMDTTKTPDQRAAALIPCMTLDERIALMHGVGDTQGHTGYVPANTRLGIPALTFTDGPAGVRPNQGQTTALPAPAALAATWDPSLAQEYGTVLGRESFDLGNNVIFALMVNITRVPQGGRDFETLGEDPYLTSQLGVADIDGIQAQHVIADVKHFAANNQEDNRGAVSADVDQRTLHEIYLPAFEAAVTQAHVGTVMAAYNRVNGVYSSENRDLLTTILKSQWGFHGWVLSDYGATHSTVPAANNGLDMELPSGQFFADALKAAVQSGQVSTATIDKHVHRILRTMFAFGLFDRRVPGGTIDARADGRIARDIAEQGTVLLKDGGALLPLSSGKLGSLAVIGPNAGQAMTGGGGSSHVNPFYTVSPLTGITNRAGTGVKVTYNDGSDPQAAANAARSSNVAVVFVGDNESEGGDRSDLALPNNQDQLIHAVAAANPRTIVVLNAGAPVLMPWADGVQGIVQAWYPGEEDGNAIAAVLFGDVNPSGKLPVTFPKSVQDVAANTPQQYPGVDGVAHYSEGVFVGYRYADQNRIAPLFPFGYGLSYTTFGYSNLSVTTGGQSAPYAATVGLDVTNTGQRAGAEVAQLYLGIPATNVPEPPRQLKGFQKVLLQPGQTQHVTFTLNARDLSYWDTRADGWVVQRGTYQVMVGGSSRDLPLRGSFAVSQANGPRYVTVQAPSIVQAGTRTAVTTTFTNGGDSGWRNVGLSLHTPSGWTAVATSPTTVASLGAGQSERVTWQVTIPANAGSRSFTLAEQAAYTGEQGAGSSRNNVTVAIPFTSLDKAYNNVGISDNSNPAAGNDDGSGYSYSAQALAAVGLTPGALVTHGGVAFTWPNAPAGTADNVVANGQVINLSGSGQTLGFLGAGSFATQSGTGLVTYTDGSTQPFTIAVADWYANSPAAGGDTLATASNWNEPSGGIGSHPVSVYYAPVSLKAGKTVQEITLPTNGNMHIFAVATSGGASGGPGPSPTPTATPTTAPTSTPSASGSGSSCGTTNLALNRPASASSSEGAGLNPNNAVDGNTGTRWGSQFSDPQWLQVDLGLVRSVCKVVLNWETAYGKQYQIQVSNDAQTWTSIYNQANGTGGTETLNVSGSGRYVRMYGTQRGTGYGYSLWEFQVYGSSGASPTATPPAAPTSTPAASGCGTTNVALNQPATASSLENAGTPASAAVDGNTGTRWSSQFSDPQWLQVDLGSARSVCKVVLQWEAAYGKQYQIQVSNDASTWTSIYNQTNGAGGVETLNVSGSGRYIRMYGTQRGTGYGYSLWEFQVYSTGGGASPTATPTTAPTATPAATTIPTTNRPDFGPNVFIFDPSMPSATIQNQLNSVFTTQQSNQFGTQRYALLFKPGSYSVDANIGFYTSIAGLGLSPDDVTINGNVHVEADWSNGNATQNFWRSAENMAVVPPSGTDRWAVAQAAPFRRMHVRGNLDLAPAGEGWASGGYIADTKVDGQVSSGSQQWITRDSTIGSWAGSVWNMVFSGVSGAPAQHFPNPSYTVVNQSPVTREKPYLYIDGSGNDNVFVPSLRQNSSGITWANGPTPGSSIPLSQFYVARPGDSVATLNAALSQGLNLLFTPGIYHVDQTINVTKANTVVLGLGFPTIIPDGGVVPMQVADVDGVKLAGLLFDAGQTTSPVLLQVGPTGASASHAANPTSVQDVFFRIGGAGPGLATTSLVVNTNDTIIDHIWAWRADHGAGVGWTSNTADTGLIVNGANVMAYGLFVEHFQKYEVIWNGNNGRDIFFQNEMPYDPPNQAAWMNGSLNGYAAYKVANNVTSHEAWGVGSYCYFNVNPAVNAYHAFEVPNVAGVTFHDLLTVSLGGNGTITHVINDTGATAQGTSTIPVYLASYP